MQHVYAGKSFDEWRTAQMALLRMSVCKGTRAQSAASPCDPSWCVSVVTTHTGIVTLGPAAEVPLDVVRQSFEANVFGLLCVTQVSKQLCICSPDLQPQRIIDRAVIISPISGDSKQPRHAQAYRWCLINGT